MEVTREVVLEAPVEEVWEALTDPGAARGVVRERRRARPGARRRRRLPLGRRRGAPRGRRGGRPRAPLRVHVGRRGPRRDRARGGRGRHARVRHRDRRCRLEHCSLPARLGVRPRLSDIFDALADPTRRHLVEALAQREASATQLASELPVTRQAVAKHLVALRDAGLVDSRKSGRETLYQLNPAPLDAGGRLDRERRRRVGRETRAASRPPAGSAP